MVSRCLLALALVACKGGGDAPSPLRGSAAPGSAVPRAEPSLLDGVELPPVTTAGFVPATVAVPLVAVTPTALAVDGKPLLALVDGKADPGDRTPNGRGMAIRNLVEALGKAERAEVLQLAIDHRVPYRTLIEVMVSAKQPVSGWKRFDILARAGDRVVAAPLVLPEPRAPGVIDVIASDRRPDSDLDAQLSAIGPQSAKTVTQQIHRKYAAGIRRCYQTVLKQRPDAGGKVELRLTVTPTGQVTKGTARGIDPTLERCVEKLMTSWRFTKPEKELEVELPLVFTSEDARSDATPAQIEPQRPPEEAPLQLVVTMMEDEVVLWSISRLEGSMQNPKLRARADTAPAQVGEALAEIVARRWPKQRPEGSDEIILMAEAEIPMARVVEMLGAIRPAFPDIMLTAEFE